MESCSKAIEQIKIWKGEVLSYVGLKLTLEIFAGENLLQSLAVLTGERMHTDDILDSLKKEYEILDELGYELPFGIIEYNGKTIQHISNDFVMLYYFTAV